MNTNKNRMRGNRLIRLSGLLVLLLTLVGATDLAAQSWKSATEARTALKTEIVAITDAAPLQSETDRTAYEIGKVRILFYTEIYDMIREGGAVPQSLDLTYEQLFKPNSFAGSGLVTDRQGGMTVRDYYEDAKALLTN